MKSNHFPDLDPVPTGIKGRCPRCGEGALFTGLLTVKESCSACRMDFDFEDSGDGPTVFIIMGMGFLVLGMVLIVELNYQPSVWVHVVVWPIVVLAIGLPALRIVKGVLIALQFKHDAAQGKIDRAD